MVESRRCLYVQAGATARLGLFAIPRIVLSVPPGLLERNGGGGGLGGEGGCQGLSWRQNSGELLNARVTRLIRNRYKIDTEQIPYESLEALLLSPVTLIRNPGETAVLQITALDTGCLVSSFSPPKPLHFYIDQLNACHSSFVGVLVLIFVLLSAPRSAPQSQADSHKSLSVKIDPQAISKSACIIQRHESHAVASH